MYGSVALNTFILLSLINTIHFLNFVSPMPSPPANYCILLSVFMDVTTLGTICGISLCGKLWVLL